MSTPIVNFKKALRVTDEQIKGKRDDDLFLPEQAAVFQPMIDASSRRVPQWNSRRWRSMKTDSTRALSTSFPWLMTTERSMPLGVSLRISLNVRRKNLLVGS